MIKLNDFVNDETLNIFCDASILPLGNNEFAGCYGAIAKCKDRLIDQRYFICSNTTNNNSEIKAIRTGIQIACAYKQYFRNINIFSDSEISILGIRDRIFDWYLCDNNLYGFKYNKIASQSIYVEIVTMTLNNDLYIGFYHQKGHVVCSYNNNLLTARQVFKASNNIRSDIDINLIKYISDNNNKIDGLTRLALRNRTEQAKYGNYGDAIIFIPTEQLMSRLPDYKDHITNYSLYNYNKEKEICYV